MNGAAEGRDAAAMLTGIHHQTPSFVQSALQSPSRRPAGTSAAPRASVSSSSNSKPSAAKSSPQLVSQQLFQMEGYYEMRLRAMLELVNAIASECSVLIAESVKLKMKCDESDSNSIRLAEVATALEQKNREIMAFHSQRNADAATVSSLRSEAEIATSALDEERKRRSQLAADGVRHKELIETLRVDLQRLSASEAQSRKDHDAMAQKCRHQQKIVDELRSDLRQSKLSAEEITQALKDSARHCSANAKALKHALDELKKEQSAHIETDELLQRAQAELHLRRQQQVELSTRCVSLQGQLESLTAEGELPNAGITSQTATASASARTTQLEVPEELHMLRKRLTEIEIQLQEERSRREDDDEVHLRRQQSKNWSPPHAAHAGPRGRWLLGQYEKLMDSEAPPQAPLPRSESPLRLDGPKDEQVLALIESSIDRLHGQIVQARRRVDAMNATTARASSSPFADENYTSTAAEAPEAPQPDPL